MAFGKINPLRDPSFDAEVGFCALQRTWVG